MSYNTFTQPAVEVGTAEDDAIIGTPAMGANNVFNGGDGFDLIFGDAAVFYRGDFSSSWSERYQLDNPAAWSTAENPLVGDSSIPHLTYLMNNTEASSNANVYAREAGNWYSVTVGAGQTMTIDVDFGWFYEYSEFGGLGSGNADLAIALFDQTGLTLLAENSDADHALGGLGSDTSGFSDNRDPYLTYTNTSGSAQTYTFKIFQWTGSGYGTVAGSSYVMNLSVGGHATTTAYNPGNDVIDGGNGGDMLFGVDGDDVIRGGNGWDTIYGGTGNDELYGDAGMDVLNGGAGNDRLYGGDDWDTLDGGEGADFMDGGAGDDSYYVDNADDVVADSGTGDYDRIYASVSYSLAGRGVSALSLTGTAALSGYGSDQVDGISGNTGNNILYGYAGNDALSGGAGDDYLNGGEGADVMNGGAGNDTFIVDHVNDNVVENPGGGDRDIVMTSVSYSLVGRDVEWMYLVLDDSNINGTGNSLNNQIWGNAGSNILIGGEGNDGLSGDQLFRDGGADTLIGGLGDDIYVVYHSDDDVQEANGEGNDDIYSFVSYSLAGRFVERLFLYDEAGAADGTGNSRANIVVGNAFANRLMGMEGADTLVGNGGNDVLNGGTGADVMQGGSGNDIFYVDNAADAVIEYAGEGNDTLFSSVSYALAEDYISVETMTLLGTASNSLTGNTQVNRLNGNAGKNVLDGRGGADVMAGGLGDDIYYVDNVGDVVIEDAGADDDSIYSSVTYSLAGRYVETLVLTGTANIHGVGNSKPNSITGNSGNNVIRGGDGSDLLTGGAGADWFAFDTALGPNNIDRITDFSVADDSIRLSQSVFDALGSSNPLAAGAFRIGTRALDADDRIIYNSATGGLFYDADGNGAGAQVQFARLSAGLAMTHADFLVVA